jgi:hypothetical protein
VNDQPLLLQPIAGTSSSQLPSSSRGPHSRQLYRPSPPQSPHYDESSSSSSRRKGYRDKRNHYRSGYHRDGRRSMSSTSGGSNSNNGGTLSGATHPATPSSVAAAMARARRRQYDEQRRTLDSERAASRSANNKLWNARHAELSSLSAKEDEKRGGVTATLTPTSNAKAAANACIEVLLMERELEVRILEWKYNVARSQAAARERQQWLVESTIRSAIREVHRQGASSSLSSDIDINDAASPQSLPPSGGSTASKIARRERRQIRREHWERSQMRRMERLRLRELDELKERQLLQSLTSPSPLSSSSSNVSSLWNNNTNTGAGGGAPSNFKEALMLKRAIIARSIEAKLQRQRMEALRARNMAFTSAASPLLSLSSSSIGSPLGGAPSSNSTSPLSSSPQPSIISSSSSSSSTNRSPLSSLTTPTPLSSSNISSLMNGRTIGNGGAIGTMRAKWPIRRNGASGPNKGHHARIGSMSIGAQVQVARLVNRFIDNLKNAVAAR